jgi:hypothetical protein
MIDRNQAIEIARKCADENGWGWTEPLHVIERRRWFGGLDRYEIASDPAIRGTKVRIVIDAATGEIRSKGYVPR